MEYTAEGHAELVSASKENEPEPLARRSLTNSGRQP